jgi:anti-sigma B factor antagonist
VTASDEVLEIAVEERSTPSGQATLLLVRGEVDMDTADQLERAIEGAQGPLVVDLSRVPFMDSTGLRVVLTATVARDGELAFVLRSESPVLRLVELAQVEDRVPHFETEDQALESIEPAGERGA